MWKQLSVNIVFAREITYFVLYWDYLCTPKAFDDLCTWYYNQKPDIFRSGLIWITQLWLEILLTYFCWNILKKRDKSRKATYQDYKCLLFILARLQENWVLNVAKQKEFIAPRWQESIAHCTKTTRAHCEVLDTVVKHWMECFLPYSSDDTRVFGWESSFCLLSMFLSIFKEETNQQLHNMKGILKAEIMKAIG